MFCGPQTKWSVGLSSPLYARLGPEWQVTDCALTRMPAHPVDYTNLFLAYDAIESKRRQCTVQQSVRRNALQQFMFRSEDDRTSNGFARIQRCRAALESIVRQGYTRSLHRRLFHDHFIPACARIFWKTVTEPPGTIARHHQQIL